MARSPAGAFAVRTSAEERPDRLRGREHDAAEVDLFVQPAQHLRTDPDAAA